MIIANEVDKLAESLRGIRAAITERGGTVSATAGFKDLPEAVRSIPAGDSYYDAFWDGYQQNGERVDYANAFSGRGWTIETFKPKYDIVSASNSYMLFRHCGITDLGEAIRASGKRLIITGSALSMAFNSTLCEIIDEIEFEQALTNIDSCFNYSNDLREIKVVLPISEKATSLAGFAGCYALEEVRFSGTIATSTLNLQWSTKLSKASIENIIGCLSTTTSGLSITLSGAAVEAAFGSTASAEWINLINTRANWTIVLI